MKAITIWQPWSSLLACGAKGYETRSWATSYRGQVAIHAAKMKPSGVLKKMFPLNNEAEREFLNAVGFAFGNDGIYGDIEKDLEALPCGCIIATAELINCWQVLRQNNNSVVLERFDEDGNHYFKDITGTELLFGDFTPNRYIWEFANMAILPEPIPAKGKQRLWEWEGL